MKGSADSTFRPSWRDHILVASSSSISVVQLVPTDGSATLARASTPPVIASFASLQVALLLGVRVRFGAPLRSLDELEALHTHTAMSVDMGSDTPTGTVLVSPSPAIDVLVDATGTRAHRLTDRHRHRTHTG